MGDRGLKIYLVILVVFFGLHSQPLAAVAGEEELVGRILQDFTGVESETAEGMFIGARDRFDSRQYRKAREEFLTLRDEYPESKRALDSLYYLERLSRIKGFSEHQSQQIKVLLAATNGLIGTVESAADLSGKRGELLLELEPGVSWEVVVTATGELRFISGDHRLSGKQFEIFSKNLSVGPVFTLDGVQYRGNLSLENREGMVLAVNELPLEKYLYGVVKKETAPGWSFEALKAQAVASRSFVVNSLRLNSEGKYHIRADISAQLYEGYTAETVRGRRAVRATAGEVLVHRGGVVPAYFHSNSGGYIEDGEQIWGGRGYEFIRPASDSWSLDVQHSVWMEEFIVEELNSRLSEAGLPELARRPNFKTGEALPSGRAVSFQYRGENGNRVEVSANRFRTAVGGGRFRSTWLEQVEERAGRLKFRGRGWGHGVGMSQWGANAMSRAGFDYREILNFYYQRARIFSNYGSGQPVRPE